MTVQQSTIDFFFLFLFFYLSNSISDFVWIDRHDHIMIYHNLIILWKVILKYDLSFSNLNLYQNCSKICLKFFALLSIASDVIKTKLRTMARKTSEEILWKLVLFWKFGHFLWKSTFGLEGNLCYYLQKLKVSHKSRCHMKH